MFFIGLVGCGGGDGGLSSGGTSTPGTGSGGTTEDIVITLTISNELVTEQSPATITATVMQGDSAIGSKVVTFTTTLGNFNPESGTALTDSSGVATIVLNSGDIAGAGTVTASIDSGEEQTIGFTTQGKSETVVRLGSGTSDSFSEGTIDLSLQQISAGSTTTVSVILVDDTGALYTESVDVNFTSVCAEEAIPTAEIDSVVKTSSGQASANYLAKGCVGDDPITVNAIVNGQNLSATGTVNVLPADIGSIEFVSATPETIGIIGTGAVGGSESSTIVFKVLDTNGNPVNNQDVDFALSTQTGGVNLIPARATTNSQGLAQTVVNSGSVATSVRVTASVVGSEPLIASQSSVLVISTGIPDQDSFSLSAEYLNPEGWSRDGTEVMIVARLADAYNNPVPDGTAVSFTTEGGSIEPSCTTVDGACTVKWTSQYPRPEGHVLGDANNPSHLPEEQNTMGQKYGGRATIVATAIGEESFPDLNGNGRFDESEMSAFLGTDVSGQPYDLKEAYADYNEDGFFNPGETNAAEQSGGELEEFYDFNDDGVFSLNDGKYNGVLCSIPAHSGCSTEQKSINVRGQITLVMSGSTAHVVSLTPVINIAGEGSATGSIIVSDLHNQPMPYGTEIKFSTTVGSIVAGGTASWGSDNHNGGQQFNVAIKGEKEPKTGTLYAEISSPFGSGIVFSVATVNIN
ncbi:hypothetical protein [Thalassotalea sp. G2M2-11]|uniref:hypothetical protein n=1 Tax=Thalassotalea sp. G2M2-11 TaxID=2787627 RepID=UPI001F492F2C|nr:hypothetical protein [Thalassotalea sp. G2M2-11]